MKPFSTNPTGCRAASRLGLLAALLIGHALACADVTSGDNVILPIKDADGVESRVNFAPTVAYDPANLQYLVTWTATDNDPQFELNGLQYNKVLGLFLKVDSETNEILPVTEAPFILSKEYGLDPDDGDNTLGGANPAVVFDAQRGQYFVAYRRTYPTGQKPGILGRVVSDTGDIGKEIQILTAGDTLPSAPIVAYDSTNGRYLVAWTVGGNISGSLVNATDPTTPGNAQTLATGAEHPALAFNSQTGEYLLAFDAGSAASNSQDIFIKRIGATGQAVDTTPIAVTSDASTQASPRVVYNPDDNQYAVMWTDSRNVATTGQNSYGRIVAADATMPAAELLLSTYSSAPVLGWARSEKLYLLEWTKQRATAPKDGYLFGRMLGSDLSSDEFPSIFAVSKRGDAQAGARSLAFDAIHRKALSVWTRSTGDGQSVIAAQLLNVSSRVTNLRLKVKDDPDPLVSGQPLTYEISAINTGKATARVVTVSVRLPSGMVYSGFEPLKDYSPAITCPAPSTDPKVVINPVECALDNIKPGATKALKLRATATANLFGTISSQVELAWDNLGSTPKTKAIATEIVYPGTLSISSPAPDAVLHPGDVQQLTWQLVTDTDLSDTTFAFKTSWSADNGKSWAPLDGAPVRDGTSLVWNQSWTVPAVAANRTQTRIRVEGTATVTDSDGNTSEGRIESAVSQPFTLEVVKLTAPNTSTPVDAGSSQTVSWNYYGTKAPVDQVRLDYSLDKGRRWKRIATVGANPAGSAPWSAPFPLRNVEQAKVRVTLLTSGGKSVGSDVSDASFPIRVLELTGPTGTVSGGEAVSITWKTYGTRAEVAGWKLQLSKDNGASWKTVGDGSGNPEAHFWVPDLKRQAPRCKLRLILVDAEGKRVAVDTQSQAFSIQP